jgi:7,8-didemethyl-8-hydroxy-5-deazariboflavin synthase CofG subunit
MAEAPLRAADAGGIVRSAVDAGRLERAEAEALGRAIGDPQMREVLFDGATESKRRGKGDAVTVSRNVFIPLTNLCRDRCAYCTFAKQPDSAEAKTYTLEEVADVVRGGVRTGCHEALFCLGDKPEIAYRSYREMLAARGYETTTDLLAEACRVGLAGGMLPHTNAGILSTEEMKRLRPLNASMGLMLETTSARLRGKGMAHQYAPDKEPSLRIRMHEEAGELRIPFTTGILLGIGENAEERVDTLLEIRRIQDRWGHLQEAIIQPFHPKPGTRMRFESPLPDAEAAGWVALARLVLGPDMNVQAPPNLGPEVLELLLRAGVNDWGGVSPVTVDFINPEAPWPTLQELRRRTEAGGARLVDRLPVYPEHLADPAFFEPAVREAALRMATDEGYARPGAGQEAA